MSSLIVTEPTGPSPQNNIRLYFLCYLCALRFLNLGFEYCLALLFLCVCVSVRNYRVRRHILRRKTATVGGFRLTGMASRELV
jgi:hypothetical protein